MVLTQEEEEVALVTFVDSVWRPEIWFVQQQQQ